MKKIGRNEKCPCGSGKKFKRCCSLKPKAVIEELSQAQQMKVTLAEGIDSIQKVAKEKQRVFLELGVFILFSTIKGDAWLLEMTDSDCVQVAAAGEPLARPIDENPETIEIDWTHTYTIKTEKLQITSYKDTIMSEIFDAPSKEIGETTRRLMKQLSPEFIDKVHIAAEKE